MRSEAKASSELGVAALCVQCLAGWHAWLGASATAWGEGAAPGCTVQLKLLRGEEMDLG